MRELQNDTEAASTKHMRAGGFEPIPEDEDGEAAEMSGRERVRIACKVLGMSAVGVAIGCAFVAMREALGFET